MIDLVEKFEKKIYKKSIDKKEKKIKDIEFKDKLPEKYTMKILFRQNNKKFENKYLKKLKSS